MTPDRCDVVGPGAIRFYDNYVPALDAGDYLINVTQRVNPTGSGVDECFPASQAFSVAGPRWSLPAADLFSVYPPREAVGAFDQDLPHVVLTRRELPWERNVFDDTENAQQTPWLALLVLDPDELLVDDPGTANRTRSTVLPVNQLFDQPAGDGNTRWPRMTAEWYEADAIAQQTCTVIDIAPDTFTGLLPGPESLRYFAHARLVDVTAKDAGVLTVTGDGWYSVVVANRLPAASSTSAQRSIAHLVSLEGLADCVIDPSNLNGFAKVRIVSLVGWSFTCVAESGATFAELIKGLEPNGTAMALPVALPSDADGSERQAAQTLARGYVPLPWRTRLGEQTWGWYRGPFSAEPVTEFVDAEPPSGPDHDGHLFDTASAALVYDPHWGVFDLSYAVAWETGRLMALADGAFSRALVDWQRRGYRLADLIAERMAQIPALSTLSLDDPVTEAQVLELIKSYSVTDDFMRYLVTQFGAQIAPTLAAPDTRSPDPPLPPYADLPPPPPDPRTLADLMLQPGIREAIRSVGGKQLDAIADWLAQRYALMGVPFEALVPSADLLPTESIRFFYMDVNWLDALLEGAMSIGIESSRDAVYQDLMKDLVWDTAIAAVQQLRAQLLGQTPPPTDGWPEGLAGMLLRSALVSGWPGLEIRAYSQPLQANGRPDPGTEIPLLRMERLSSGVLLCLWPKVPVVVAVDEPREGIAFGFEDAPQGDGRTWLYLRSVEPDTYGQPAPDKQFDATPAIDPATRVLNVADLLSSMSEQLGADLAVRDFATQMIQVPEQGLFTHHE